MVGGEPAGSSLLVLRALREGASRELAIRLLLRTGRSEAFVRASCERGQVLGFAGIDCDGHDGPVGALLSVPAGAGPTTGPTTELRVLSLAPGAADAGGELLGQFADSLRARGVHRVLAPASNAELGLVGLLVDAGYRFLHVERDACTPERGFPGPEGRNPHRDLVWLELEL